jgi:hypothetical protein
MYYVTNLLTAMPALSISAAYAIVPRTFDRITGSLSMFKFSHAALTLVLPAMPHCTTKPGTTLQIRKEQQSCDEPKHRDKLVDFEHKTQVACPQMAEAM